MKKTLLARGAVVVLALAHLTCGQAILTAPLDSTLDLFVNPRSIAAHGGVSVVSAFVLDGTGNPVPDGTVVQFFTTLGRIQEQGKTNDGVARVNLTSDSRSGRAEITAFSGEASNTESVDIGAVRPTRVFVRAEPTIITNSRSTHIIATVLDENGDPVPNVPVVFSVAGAFEFLDSSGQPIFTNNNGEAEDVMRTRRTAGAVGTAVVTATVLGAGDVTNTVTVQLQLQ